MTREEKISRLKDILSEINENDNAVCYLTSEDNELIESVIEALEQESCDDCISRQALIDAYGDWYVEEGTEEGFIGTVKQLLELAQDLSSACTDSISRQPQPKIGQWVLLDECSNCGYYCSECHKKLVKEGWSDTVKKIKYCPNCGAKLVELQAE